MPPVGFEPVNPSTQAAADPSLRLRGQCDQLIHEWLNVECSDKEKIPMSGTFLRMRVHPVTTVVSRDVTRVLSILHEFITQ